MSTKQTIDDIARRLYVLEERATTIAACSLGAVGAYCGGYLGSFIRPKFENTPIIVVDLLQAGGVMLCAGVGAVVGGIAGAGIGYTISTLYAGIKYSNNNPISD